MTVQELNMLIEKPVFVNTELEAPISLKTAAKNRYSDAVLNQVYKISLPKSNDRAEKERADKYALEMQDKLITFTRNEIFYNDRKSVMLNLRDISDIQNLNKKIKDNETLQLAYQKASSELVVPFSQIEEIHNSTQK